MKNVNLHIKLEAEEKKALTMAVKRTGHDMSHIIRSLIRDYLNKYVSDNDRKTILK